MPAPRRWTRDELLLAMHLYCRIPFGRQHAHAPEVVELAAALGRTPASVAMKLNNLTSLDPEERARGVKGLSGASDLDRQVWAEFQARWDDLATESETLWQQTVSTQGAALGTLGARAISPAESQHPHPTPITQGNAAGG